MSWLAKQVGGAMDGGRTGGRPSGQGLPDSALPGRTGQPAPGSAAAPESRGVDPTSILQDILGSALGGATGRQPQQGGGGILGDVLGSILGGRR